jgi:hypothetical protein
MCKTPLDCAAKARKHVTARQQISNVHSRICVASGELVSTDPRQKCPIIPAAYCVAEIKIVPDVAIIDARVEVQRSVASRSCK